MINSCGIDHKKGELWIMGPYSSLSVPIDDAAESLRAAGWTARSPTEASLISLYEKVTTPTPEAAAGPTVSGLDREMLGRLVREVWIEWAREQSAPKPSWLVPWEGLSEPDREVDRRIGERVANVGRRAEAAAQQTRDVLLRGLTPTRQTSLERASTWIARHRGQSVAFSLAALLDEAIDAHEYERRAFAASPATKGLDFGAALAWMRAGRKVRRERWQFGGFVDFRHLERNGTDVENVLATDWEVVEEPPHKPRPCDWCPKDSTQERTDDDCGAHFACLKHAQENPDEENPWCVIECAAPATPPEQGAPVATAMPECLWCKDAATQRSHPNSSMLGCDVHAGRNPYLGPWTPLAPKSAEPPPCGHRGLCTRAKGHEHSHMSANGVRDHGHAGTKHVDASGSAVLLNDESGEGGEKHDPGAAERVLEEALRVADGHLRVGYEGRGVAGMIAPLREVLRLAREEEKDTGQICPNDWTAALRALDESCGK